MNPERRRRLYMVGKIKDTTTDVACTRHYISVTVRHPFTPLPSTLSAQKLRFHPPTPPPLDRGPNFHLDADYFAREKKADGGRAAEVEFME